MSINLFDLLGNSIMDDEPRPLSRVVARQTTTIRRNIEVDALLDNPCPSTGRIHSTFIPNRVANVQFDAGGDVVLLLRNNKGTARFQVNSSILCMSSPVFRAMLGAKSHFKEAKELANCDPSMEPVEVNIEDDDPDVLAVILRILHHQHDSVPKAVKEDKLYQIAIVCDKYDLRQALSFWLDKWIPAPHDLRSVILRGSVASQDKRRLFMAYVFRKEEVFKAISKDLILTYKDQGPFWAASQFGNIPQTIVDAIMAARRAAIAAIFSCVRQSISKYDDPMKVQCQHKREYCDAFVLGLLIREFKRIGVYPETLSIHQQSVKDIRGKIASMKQPQYAFFGMGCNKPHALPANEVNHANCAPIGSILTEVSDIIIKIEGLEYSRFVRTGKDKGNIGSYVEANADLWNCLKYM